MVEITKTSIIRASTLLSCLSLLFTLIALSGGSWSVTNVLDEDENTLQGTFGLSEWKWTGESISHSKAVKYSSGLKQATDNSAPLTEDFTDVSDAGGLVTAFLTLAFLFLLCNATQHLIFVQERGNPRNHITWAAFYPITVLSTMCLFLSVIFWALLGDYAALHVSVDSYNFDTPDSYYGYCFNLAATSFVFMFLDMTLVYIYITLHQPMPSEPVAGVRIDKNAVNFGSLNDANDANESKSLL